MSQSDLVREFYLKYNESVKLFQKLEYNKEIKIDLTDYSVRRDEIGVKLNDYPYMRIAMIDKHLESTNA